LIGFSMTGSALLGSSDSGSGVEGISSSGIGVQGTNWDGVGVQGNGATGVRGSAWGGYGVVGSDATSGYGGYFTSATGTAVFAISGASSNTGPALHGLATSSNLGVGVKGEAMNGSTGVWGYNPGHVAAWFSGNAYADSWRSTSDARLKKDVRDLSYGLKDLLRLHPVNFRWKKGDDGVHSGLIAQEVEQVMPEIVSHERGPASDTETLTVNYTELVPVLIKTVQEQNARISELEARVRAPVRLSSLYDLGGGAALGLLPLGLVLAWRRRKDQAAKSSRESGGSVEPR
jgi:hypothetical protein